MNLLRAAREALRSGEVHISIVYLYVYRFQYAEAPASTRRRWRCGR
jgi:hypothetical protein